METTRAVREWLGPFLASLLLTGRAAAPTFGCAGVGLSHAHCNVGIRRRTYIRTGQSRRTGASIFLLQRARKSTDRKLFVFSYAQHDFGQG